MLQETIPIHYSIVFQKAQEALQELNISFNVDNQNWIIKASTQTSWLSWGETVLVQINMDANGNTLISITSTAKAQLINWGKNTANETAILSKIKNLLSIP